MTGLECPFRIWPQHPEEIFQIRIVLSPDPETIMVPVGEYAMEKTPPVCPSNFVTKAPVCTSHTLTVVSYDPEMRNTSSEENAMDVTGLSCPVKVAKHTPVPVSRIRTHDSLHPAIKRPLNEKTTEDTSSGRPSGIDLMQASQEASSP